MAFHLLLTWRLLFDKLLVFPGCKLHCFPGYQGFRDAKPSRQFFDPLPEHITAGKVKPGINTGRFFTQNVFHHAELFEAVLPVPARNVSQAGHDIPCGHLVPGLKLVFVRNHLIQAGRAVLQVTHQPFLNHVGIVSPFPQVPDQVNNHRARKRHFLTGFLKGGGENIRVEVGGTNSS